MPDGMGGFAQHAPGLGGALLAALIKLKEGWRIVISQFVMGAIAVFVLRGTIAWAARKFDAPVDLLGFAVGWLGVATATKVLETVQKLEFAKPINSFIERWVGTKAPNSTPSQEEPKP